ncbi:hypothetical protein EYZ11_005635 [Aspergillus tanneri]|uniref:Uncharacterized protein n=1 Tax=Aspergillus tanneri TaxID=1220188 RepID=A0A4S3JHM2_9EURO|nr:hypothetical protein EYZ11_005635 [Aspergillus tanneri]
MPIYLEISAPQIYEDKVLSVFEESAV